MISCYRPISFCILFIALFASSGCLQTGYDLQNQYLDDIARTDTSADKFSSDLSSNPENFDISYDVANQIEVELDFESFLKPDLFQTRGTLAIQSDTPLPYLLLNSTLWKDGRLVEKTRYMMIEVDPGRTYEFDICQSRFPTSESYPRLSPEEDYLCVLEIQSPGDWWVSETQECQVIQGTPSESSPVTVPEYGTKYLEDRLDEVERSGYDASDTLPAFGIEDEASKRTATFSSSSPPSSYQRDTGESISETSYDRDDAQETENQQNLQDPIPQPVLEPIPENSETGKRDDFVAKGTIYVGSLSSDKYHLPECRYAQKIKPENRIYFKDVWEAREMGYVPCKVCNPS